MFKLMLLLLTPIVIVGCGGGGSSEEGSTTATYKAELISSGWDCGPTDTSCYKVQNAALLTTSIYTKDVSSEQLDNSDTLMNFAIESVSSSLKLLASCSTVQAKSTVKYTCYVDDEQASVASSNISELEMELSVKEIDNDANGLPFSVSSTKTILDASNLPSYLSTSLARTLRKSYYEHAGYQCGEDDCYKLTSTLSANIKLTEYDTAEKCTLSDGACGSVAAIEWAMNLSDFIDEFKDSGLLVYSAPITPFEVSCAYELKNAIYCISKFRLNSSSSTVSTVASKVELAPEVSEPTTASQFTFTGEGKSFSELQDRNVNSIVLNNFKDSLFSEYYLGTILPDLPVIPSDDFAANLPTEVTNKLQSFRTNDNWGGTSNIEDARAPACFARHIPSSLTPDAWISCYAFESDTTVHECTAHLNLGSMDCSTLTGSELPYYEANFDQMLEFHGFDYGYDDLGVAHSSSYPIVVVDSGCEIGNDHVSSRISQSGVYYTNSGNNQLQYSSTTSEGAMRFDLDPSYWESHGSAHCTNIMGVTSTNEGAYLNVVNVLDGIGASVPTLKAKMESTFGADALLAKSSRVPLGESYNTVFAASSSNQLLVNSGGNSSEDWSDLVIVADVESIESAVIVGSVGWGKELSDFSAVPGENASIQLRWITALGENIVTAASVSNTSKSIIKTDGTSLANQFVSRALDLAKSYCTKLNYRDLAQVMLNTADHDFDGYNAEEYGQGILDVKSMMTKLQGDGCSI
ncbi:S8 family serine peptidase [Rhodanobacter aciditrophus]|uniref:S8 family serine peptidase n=1 Tax=Rhodanobacter aciditrophus TaxID=1623218 RepID=A0ABW4B4Y4_9GAMM